MALFGRFGLLGHGADRMRCKSSAPRGTRRALGCHLEQLERRDLLTISIAFDYSFDTTGFFSSQSRRDLLDQAASVYEGRINDALAAISPSGSNTWNAIFNHPATGAQVQVANASIAANSIRVYVGSRDLAGSTLAEGGPGGFNASGSTSWVQVIQARGQTGALQAPATDFGPWGGVITFDPNVNWFFGSSTAGLVAGMTDFVTVAMHELGHVLGFGNTVPNNSFLRYVSGSTFAGPNAEAVYDAVGPVPLAPDHAHWQDGLTDGGLSTIMDPSISSGVRTLPTPLDFAALADIGWFVSSNIAPSLDTSGNPQLATISEDPISNSGTLVTSILASAAGGNPVFDPDGPQVGIAITGVDTSHGAWQYSTNSGVSWQAMGTPSTATARLLAADANTMVRFVPSANFNGTVSAGISFRAWDRSAGNNGGVADTTTNGGSTPFSTAIETASITVMPVADAPGVTPASTLEDTQTTTGLVISRNAADGAEVTHFKIFNITGGTLYLNDGVTQVAEGSFITVAQGAAGLKFTPADDSVAQGSFTVRASTSASDAGLGGAPIIGSISVTAVNDAPTFVAGPDVSVQNPLAQSFTAWATNISKGPVDENWQSLHFTVTPDKPELFDVQPAIDTSGKLTFTPAAHARGSTTVTVELQDSGGTANGGQDTSSEQTFTITIDTAPWQNPEEPLDVDQSGDVVPLDALLVINELNDVGAHELQAPDDGPPPPFFDVNGDGVVSPLDALLVINFLNGQPASASVSAATASGSPAVSGGQLAATLPAVSGPADDAEQPVVAIGLAAKGNGEIGADTVSLRSLSTGSELLPAGFVTRPLTMLPTEGPMRTGRRDAALSIQAAAHVWQSWTNNDLDPLADSVVHDLLTVRLARFRG